MSIGRSARDAVRERWAAVRRALPRGGTLPPDDWERRHRALLAFLWVNTFAFFTWGLIAGTYGPLHDLAHGSALLVFAALGGASRLAPKVRSVAVSLGLLTAAALLVHVTGGVIEAHFYFFVVIVLLTLYEDWRPFLLAVAYVLLHHGVLGMLDPHSVFNSGNESRQPWKWATIHALFIAMAGAAAVVAWRLNEAVRERMLAAQAMLEGAAMVDSLTELPNRRQLMADLEVAARGSEPTVLGLFDLDGFKTYNDTFGHSAGDALLTRLGGRLAAAAEPPARAYRLGGDEFCVVAPAAAFDAEVLLTQAAAALSERGEGFAIGCSHGSAVLTVETDEIEEALRLADQRMYQSKNSGRPSAGRQISDVLIRAIDARNPDLGEHLYDVADLSGAVARHLGLSEEDASRVRQGAELHDVGKVAIPDAILLKPGPLSDDEWEFMRRHTLIGERIVSAAPALTRVAALVRSHHERLDGTGYPDGLAGDQIPLGARIIFVCDAFDAITSPRPYRLRTRTGPEAVAELRRSAGSQFDPAVVEALAAVVAQRADAVQVAA
jgi:diguanylate cyclase (GGDEF)-like protein